MKKFKFLEINEKSRIPKYKQIVDFIIYNISSGKLKVDDKLPSINYLSEEFYLSRDTVEKAYNILKEKKVVSSIRGKGYYVTRTELLSKINVLFLINKLSSYKLRIYNSFINTVGSTAHTDLHVYHCDENLFLNLLNKNMGAYDYYVIMPHFKTKDLKHASYSEKVIEAIQQIPLDRLVVIDNNKLEIKGDYVKIYQDFEDDIYKALEEGLDKISKYKNLILAYPENTLYPYPRRILHGFRKFCLNHSLEFEIIDEIVEDMILEKGDLFITIEESDLVSIVKQIRENEMTLGKDIGVISYNDTPLKELLGITVVSTDFKAMGETAGEMILNKEKGKIRNPFNFIDRKSI